MEEEEADRGGNVIQRRVRIERESGLSFFLGFFVVVDEGMSVQPTVSRGGLGRWEWRDYSQANPNALKTLNRRHGKKGWGLWSESEGCTLS